MTPTPTSGAAIQRYKIGYRADECGQRSSTPSGIQDASGSWVRYADHVTALAAGQATAAQQSGAKLNYSVLYVYANQHGIDYNSLCVAVQEASAQPAAPQGVAYAALPTHSHAGRVYEEGFLVGACPLYTADDMRAFADATHTLRASHGQAPADAKALAEADRRAGEAERLLATCKEEVMRFEQVRSRMKYQWGADQRVSFDEIWDEALALKKAARADSVQEDAARYRAFRDCSMDDRNRLEHYSGPALDVAVDTFNAARKQGGA